MNHYFRIACVVLLPLALASNAPRYKNPIELAVSSAGDKLYVVCEGSDELAVVDVRRGIVTGRVGVGRIPKGLAVSRDGGTIYVANSGSDTVSVVEARTLKVIRTIAAGYEPTSILAGLDGTTLYTANRIGGNLSVIDAAAGQETARLAAGRGASYLGMSPDGSTLYATHILPNLGRFREAPESEITVVDTKRNLITGRWPLHNVAGSFHVAISGDGRLGVACQLRPKNLIPLAHVAHGWAIGNSLVVFGPDVGEPVQVPLDEIDRYYSLPFAVVIAADKKTAFVSTSGSDSVTVINLERLLGYVKAAGENGRRRIANDLSASANYVKGRISVGSNPKGLALSPDGSTLYVVNRLDDSISVIDTARLQVAKTIRIGDARSVTPERRGARLFHSARFSFQGQFGCASCHIEETLDGLQWDLEPDGFGIDLVDNRSIEDVAPTAPFKWNAGNPDLETECGPRTEKFFYRRQSFSPGQLTDLVTFVKSIPLRANRFRLPNDELTPAQERGQAIFERTRTKTGAAIPEELQCPVCHSGKYYTNLQVADVGTGKPTDRSPMIDVPHLTNIALTAPYLHDGSANTLEEVWTVFNPKDLHGVTNDLAKDELNDLIEYLKRL